MPKALRHLLVGLGPVLALQLLACTDPIASGPIAPPAGWSETLEQAAPSRELLDKSGIIAGEDVPWDVLDDFARRKAISSDNATFAILEIRRGKPHDLHHWHVNDQISYVAKGTLEVVVGRDARRVDAGSFYVCAANVPHSIRVLSEEAVVIDVFAPARQDFRVGWKSGRSMTRR